MMMKDLILFHFTKEYYYSLKKQKKYLILLATNLTKSYLDLLKIKKIMNYF